MGASHEFTDTRKDSPYFSDLGLTEKQKLLDVIRQLSCKLDKTFAGIAIRWVLDNPAVTSVLIGIKNREQLQDNLEAINWSLSVEDRTLLSEASDACPSGLSGTPAHDGHTAKTQ